VRFDDLKEEVLRLPSEARALLARELLVSLDTMSEAEIEKLWIDEAIRRDEDLDQGVSRVFPAKEVFDRVRSRIK
jgi:hypothetical protein